MSERFYIHYADDNNKQLIDTESDFNIHIDEIYSDEELIQLCNLLNELNDENKELKLQLEAFKDKLCELGVSDVKLYGKRYYTGLEEWLE